MTLPNGTYEAGPASGSIRVQTARAGMAARAGHDLLLEATRWSASLIVAAPSCSLTVTVDARSLEVREATGGVKPLTERDRAEIQRTIADKVLHADRHPQIEFVSRSGEVSSDGALRVAGDLTLVGVTRPIGLVVTTEPAEGGTRLRASVPLLQSDWGIRPYSALMGALKVADRVEVFGEAIVPG